MVYREAEKLPYIHAAPSNKGLYQTVFTEAAKKIATKAVKGEINPESIDKDIFGVHTSLAQYPRVDLLIRTSGEVRISNFLLWDIAYSELYFCDTLWPDFDANGLDLAINSFHSRDRRFGERNGEK